MHCTLISFLSDAKSDVKLVPGLLTGTGVGRVSIPIYKNWVSFVLDDVQVIDELLSCEVALVLAYNPDYTQVRVVYARGVGIVLLSELSFWNLNSVKLGRIF